MLTRLWARTSTQTSPLKTGVHVRALHAEMQ